MTHKFRWLAGFALLAGATAPLAVFTTAQASSSSPATVLLKQAVLPPGSKLLVNVPFSMKQQAGVPSVGPLFAAHEYVQVPLSNGQLTAFLESHLPSGSTLGSTGTAFDKRNYSDLEISFPANGPRVYLKIVDETWTARTANSSWLRVDADVAQVGERTSAETIEAPSKAIVTGYATTTYQNGSQGPSSITITGAPLGTVISTFDALPLGPTNSCMEEIVPLTMTVTLSNGAKVQVTEIECGGHTVLVKTGTTQYYLSDNDCKLLAAAVNVLPPGGSTATRNALSGCEQ
jgi:hypothetical protein